MTAMDPTAALLLSLLGTSSTLPSSPLPSPLVDIS